MHMSTLLVILLSCRLHYYYCRCLKDLGATHGGIASALVPSLLSTHPFLMTSEPNIDDPACILATAYSNVCAQAMHARLLHLVIYVLYIKYSSCQELYIEYSSCEELYIEYSSCEELYIKYHPCEQFCYS